MRTVSSHPAASSFTCASEPAALTEAQIMSDQFGALERQFTIDALIAGRSCRDALQRVCQWHKDRGMEEPKSCLMPQVAPLPAPAAEPSQHPERG